MDTENERTLVLELAEQLKPKVDKIWTHKKPSASPKFREEIKYRLNGYLPILQPEIDMCIRLNDGQLVAVEAKLFKGDLTFSTPFYEGIGQALALHRYGFDAVALWFLFPEGKETKGMNQYGAEAWCFVRKDICLPLDFSYFSAKQEGDHRVFEVMQYDGRQTGFKIRSIDDPLFKLSWRYPNPFKGKPIQKALRETLELYLKSK